MPGTMPTRGNMVTFFAIGPSLTPAAVNTITTAEQTFTVPGLLVGDIVSGCCLQAAQTDGVGIVGARVSAANTLAIRFDNPTAGSVTPAAGVYACMIGRPESALPANAV